jgi:DNA-binding response OmpR family regulator
MTDSTAIKILVVDDEEIIHDLLSKIFMADGIQIFSAYDGQEGLDYYQKCNPDLVILDIKMPNVDGVQFLATMKKKYQKQCPVVVISGGYEKEQLDDMKSLGICAFLGKPFNIKELRSTVNLCLNNN